MSKKAIKDRETKSQILSALAEETGLTKKEVQAVLLATKEHAARHLAARGSGEMTIPEIGIKGNTHFPFSDLNNLEIADLMSKWLKEKGLD